jgi:hypothetical protein
MMLSQQGYSIACVGRQRNWFKGADFKNSIAAVEI